MGRTYTCKECGEAFHRSQHETCPECGAKPTRSNRKKPPKKEPVAVEVSEANSASEANIVDYSIDEPKKFVVNSVDYYTEVTIIGDEATMTFQNQVVAGKTVYCPRCNKRQFDVQILYGTMVRRCDRCKLTITMVFS